MGVPLASLFLFLLMGCSPSVAMAQGRFRLVEYNCENLFDTVHDAGKDDVDFLPEAERRWDSRKFWRKLTHLSKVIMACGEGQLPDLVALCEVENDSCMYALTRKSPLRTVGYEYVMTDSPDPRGIDVALLYQPGTFRLLSSRSYRVSRPTRDILHVTGLVQTLDTLDVFVCHLPSRRSGQKASEPFRLEVACLLKAKADSVVAVRRRPIVVIAGDFNDEPENRSLHMFSPGYVILTTDVKGTFHPKDVAGTYYYKGIWHRLDNLLVNKAWAERRVSSRFTPSARARILDFPFLLEENREFSAMKPRSFLKGFRFNGGYSDHLPVCLDFEYEQ